MSIERLTEGARVTRQAIVKHLQVLEGAGLVTHERRGREVLYALETRRLEEAREFLDRISAGWDRAIERLRQLEGAGTGSEATEQQTLAAIRDAEKVRRQALGLPGRGE